MPWWGSWNGSRTVFIGTFTAPDGTVFAGTWAPPQDAGLPASSADPPLYTAPDGTVAVTWAPAQDEGLPASSGDPLLYTAPDGTVVAVTWAPAQDAGLPASTGDPLLYTAPDGTVVAVMWAPAQDAGLPASSDDPPLSSDDAFFLGAPMNNRDAHQGWSGFWHNGVWTGKYKNPATTFEFAGTMRRMHLMASLEGDPKKRRG
jgi:hypothetical protein